MILLGDNQIRAIYLGNSEVTSIYQGDELIYTASAPITNYVTFTAQEANSTIGLQQLSSNQELWYSIDGEQWEKMTTAITITGDSCYIAGILNGNNTGGNYTQFRMTGKIAASGNCNYLWNHKNPGTPLKPYCGYSMFNGCDSLTTAPELPATALTDSCYSNMFNGCTSLTTTPELPATELAEECYNYMFYNCSGLTTAPSILPATTLANSCYHSMFKGCSSLTTAPELPATTLAANYCYLEMFYNCTKLNYIKCLATNRLASYCTSDWVKDVASTGTFVKHPNATSWPIGSNGIPSNWTVEDAQ